MTQKVKSSTSSIPSKTAEELAQIEKNKTRPQRKINQRFFINTPKGPMPIGDQDKAVEGVYAILPRYEDSKQMGVEVSGTCKVTGVRFVAVLPESKQKDGSWKAELTIHPVLLRRQLLALERRESQITLLKSRHGESFAALFQVKR